MEATTLRSAGWRVAAICPRGIGGESHYECVDGIHIYRHDLPSEGSDTGGYLREYAAAVRWQFRLAQLIRRRHGFDVVHICNPPDLLFLVAARYKLFRGVRVVFDQHDIMPELYDAKFGRRDVGYAAVVAAERLTYAIADVVIATNDSYRRIALSRGRKRPEQVFVVRSAPDLARFHALRPEPALKRGRRFLVGYVGVMGPQEGLDHLLHAIAMIVDRHGRRDITFRLIGDGPSRPSLLSMARDLGIDGFVDFPGRIPDEALMRDLSTCDLCVNPDPLNPFNDASSMNKILEYMALARPVVQFDLTEGRRSAGEASAYASPNDDGDLATTIIRVLDDPELRARMSREGMRRMTEELEWRHQAPRLIDAYEYVTRVRRRTRSVMESGHPPSMQE